MIGRFAPSRARAIINEQAQIVLKFNRDHGDKLFSGPITREEFAQRLEDPIEGPKLLDQIEKKLDTPELEKQQPALSAESHKQETRAVHEAGRRMRPYLTSFQYQPNFSVSRSLDNKCRGKEAPKDNSKKDNSSFCYYLDLSLTVGQTSSDVATQENANIAFSASFGKRFDESNWKLVLQTSVTERS